MGLAWTDLIIPRPELWWPKGYGAQTMHEVTAAVYIEGRCEDKVSKTIGFRRVEMPADMKFFVNGVHVKLWGSIMHPIDSVTNCWNQERVLTLIDLIDDCNMNILRIWAENEPYRDSFYQEMDRRGIMVWQDFSTANQLPDKGNSVRSFSGKRNTWSNVLCIIRRFFCGAVGTSTFSGMTWERVSPPRM